MFDFPPDCLNFMTFQLYMTLQITSESLGFPYLITLIYDGMAHISDVADITRHENARMFMLLLVCMLSYSAPKWWISSSCITTSPLHGKVCGGLNVHWVHLMFHVQISPCLYLDVLNMFVRLQKYILTCSFVHEHVLACSSIHLFINTSPCMHHSLVHSPTHPFACTLLVHPVCHYVMYIHVPMSIIPHEEMIENPHTS